MNLFLLDKNDPVRIYELPNSDRISITINDSFEEIVVKTILGENIGKIKFIVFLDYETYSKLAWMFLDGCKGIYLHRGIGRTALQFYKDYSGYKIYAEDNDGIEKDDGSHLTGDGAYFVYKMRCEGIIEKSRYYDLN